MQYPSFIKYEEFKNVEKPYEDCNWNGHKKKLIINEITVGNRYYNQEKFSKALKSAGFLDNKSADLPGNMIMLPFGMKVLNIFNEKIHYYLKKLGMEEYSYPNTVSINTILKQKKIFPLENNLLLFGNHSDFEDKNPRGVLAPTGEALIYNHWAKLIRTSEDLPIELYRKANYFRPVSSGKHSGNSIFKSLEANDVFEFHSAFQSEMDAVGSAETYYYGLKKLLKSIDVPIIWSIRPTWTNKGGLYKWVIGGDVPLPTGQTVQVATIYNQSNIFSKVFDITFKDKGEIKHTHQITGCVTKRLLLAILMLGIDVQGNLFIHPDLSPIQISIILKTSSDHNNTDNKDILKLKSNLLQKGFRVSLNILEKNKNTKSYINKNNKQGVPVQIIITDKRFSDDKYKVILIRSDTLQERIIFCSDFTNIYIIVHELIQTITNSYKYLMNDFMKFQLTKDFDKNTKIKEIPLYISIDVIKRIESKYSGEVLGFKLSENTEVCVISKKNTKYIAYFSRRI